MLKISEDVNSFPIGAIASYYKCVTQNKFLILRLWGSGVRKASHWAKSKIIVGLHSFPKFWERICFLVFLVPRSCRNPLLHDPFLCSCSRQCNLFLLRPSCTLKFLVIGASRANPDYSPHQDLQWNHFCKILLSTKRLHSQVLGIRTWIDLGWGS